MHQDDRLSREEMDRRERQHRQEKFLIGAAAGAWLTYEHAKDPRGFWRAVRLIYIAVSLFWVAGALDSTLDTSSRVAQGILGSIGVLMGAWMLLTRWATHHMDKIDPDRDR